MSKKSSRKRLGFRPEALAGFLEAAYDLEADDETWLGSLVDRGREVWGRGGGAHAAIYDASDLSGFRLETMHARDLSDAAIAALSRSVELFTPEHVATTFRVLTAVMCRKASRAALGSFYAQMETLGHHDCMGIGGIDPSGHGIFLGYWTPEPLEPPAAEMAVYRRLGHHMAAAHRIRRRLRREQDVGAPVDLTKGAEAILDARQRIVHAVGPAQAKDAQLALAEASAARDLSRGKRSKANEGLVRWPALTSARWTLVDKFERGGARYIVARENQTRVQGLAALSERERQAVAYLAIGQSTKETAYALGISDTTVRVLLSRAATKLGVTSRAGLLAHPEVRPLRPLAKG